MNGAPLGQLPDASDVREVEVGIRRAVEGLGAFWHEYAAAYMAVALLAEIREELQAIRRTIASRQ